MSNGCPNCHGSGRGLFGGPCPACKGTGDTTAAGAIAFVLAIAFVVVLAVLMLHG